MARDVRRPSVGLGLVRALDGASISDPKSFAYRFTRPLDEATYIAMLNDWVALAKKPWPEMFSGEEPLVEKWESRQSPLHMLSNTASRGCGIGIDAMARSEALNRFATLAIALERVRRASGRPAERLQDLVPEFIPAVQDDPFTGEPFCYESDGSRYVLYSKARHDPIRTALKVADVLKVDPSRLLELRGKRGPSSAGLNLGVADQHLPVPSLPLAAAARRAAGDCRRCKS